MKIFYLFISLFTLSAIFMIDYLLVVAIGITANQFGATISFYELMYPYIIVTIVAASIIAPMLVLHKHYTARKGNSVVHSIRAQSSILINQTA